MSRRTAAFSIAFLMLSVLAFPAFAKADNVQVSFEFVAKPDGALPYNRTANLANTTDENMSQYATIWRPFYQNNSDINGSTVSPFVPPVAVLVNATTLQLVQKIRFTSQQVISGGSVSIWRSPMGNFSTNTSLTFRVYRIDASNVNVSSVNGAGPIFSDPSNVQLVYQTTRNPFDDDRWAVRSQNVSAAAGSNFTYRFTLLRAFFPVLPNKIYYAYWSATNGTQRGYSVYFTSNDVSGDASFQSFIRKDGSLIIVPTDLDQSVIFEYGLSNGIAGFSTACSTYGYSCGIADEFVDFNISTSRVITNSPGAYSYFNMVVPVIFPSDPGPGNQVLLLVTFHATDSSFGATSVFHHFSETRNLWLFSYNISAGNPALIGKTINRIEIEIDHDGSQPDFLMYLSATTQNDWTNLTFFEPGPSIDRHIPAWRFQVFGYFQIDNFFFENTNKNIILIPAEQPMSDLGILKAWQTLKAQIETAGPAKDCANVKEVEFETFGLLSNPVVGGVDLLTGKDPALADCIIRGVQYVFGSVYRFLEPFLAPIGQFLYGVGTWIWNAIQFVIQTIQWFLFWLIKFVNVFLVGVIFAIAYSASTYVGKGFYEYVRSGYDADVMREIMRLGWERVWSLIHLLLIFVTMVLAAVGLVASIVGGLIP